jgi:hypothetical protein
MTKQLEELFDVESTPKGWETTVPDIPVEDTQTSLSETYQAIDKIEAALPTVRGLEASDAEMDDLAVKARESFEDLMNLGMNVDSRYASDILSVASQMLGHAITAKTAKANKKLKMIDLQLKKARLDQTSGDPNMQEGSGTLVDRNELLQSLRQAKSSDSDK